MLTLPAVSSHFHGNTTTSWTSHSRHRVDDVINHPPFHHKLRHHLRHMVSRRAQTQSTATAAAAQREQRQQRDVSDVNGSSDVNGHFHGVDEAKLGVDEMDAPTSSDSDSDPGITFIAAPENGLVETEKPGASPLQPVAAESSLPWKRGYIQPALPSHHDVPEEITQLAECPSWATSLDYVPEPGHTAPEAQCDPQPDTDDTGLFSIPPPWRTSPSSDERTENDSALPKSHIDTTDASPQSEQSVPSKPAGKPVSLKLQLHDAKNGKVKPAACCESALPWRSPSASNEVEPMISPSASQIWSHAPHGCHENGDSHHSDPITGHHHVTANIHDDLLSDYHSLLPASQPFQAAIPEHEVTDGEEDPDTAEHEAEQVLLKLQTYRRNPSFLRTKGHMLLERRPSVTLPLELNREEDCHDRIHKWLQSSHPDSLACPPDYVLDFPAKPLDETAI